ncbi:hypothetical protein V866_007855 [Kwoniella sp. B9012]
MITRAHDISLPPDYKATLNSILHKSVNQGQLRWNDFRNTITTLIGFRDEDPVECSAAHKSELIAARDSLMIRGCLDLNQEAVFNGIIDNHRPPDDLISAIHTLTNTVLDSSARNENSVYRGDLLETRKRELDKLRKVATSLLCHSLHLVFKTPFSLTNINISLDWVLSQQARGEHQETVRDVQLNKNQLHRIEGDKHLRAASGKAQTLLDLDDNQV